MEILQRENIGFFIGHLAIGLAFSSVILVWAWNNHQEAKRIRAIGDAAKKARMNIVQPIHRRN